MLLLIRHYSLSGDVLVPFDFVLNTELRLILDACIQKALYQLEYSLYDVGFRDPTVEFLDEVLFLLRRIIDNLRIIIGIFFSLILNVPQIRTVLLQLVVEEVSLFLQDGVQLPDGVLNFYLI